MASQPDGARQQQGGQQKRLVWGGEKCGVDRVDRGGPEHLYVPHVVEDAQHGAYGEGHLGGPLLCDTAAPAGHHCGEANQKDEPRPAQGHHKDEEAAIASEAGPDHTGYIA